MSKSLSLLLCLALLTSACESEPRSMEEVVEEEVVVEEVEEEEVLVEITFESSRETTVATGSSELEADTAYGFAYNSSNVLDLDYSTSWCSTAEGVPQVLSLSFPEVTELGTVGIVGGYARDEKIFFQNNRLKTVEVWYDDLPEAVDELHFEDVYGMQFFELTQEEARTVKFKIMETYSGSKYTDTCVAEVDLWSEWVEQKDADAAYNYYLEYKEAFATRPVGISSLSMGFFTDSAPYLNACEQVDMSLIEEIYHESGMSKGITDYYDIRMDEFLYSYSSNYDFWGTHSNYGEPYKEAVVNAEMNSWAKTGDTVDVRWIRGNELVASEEVVVTECQGKLYISANAAGLNGSEAPVFEVRLYYEDRLIGEVQFSLSAQ